MKRISFLAIFFVIASLGAIHAQQRTGFAYYDLDRLYDTIPSLFYDDTDYTPKDGCAGPTSVTAPKSNGQAP